MSSASSNLGVERSALGVERFDSLVTSESPWPGLSSFTEETRGFFFGREKEIDELSRLVRRETLTVLFGQSGLGKSSLLQAGLFPVLRENDHLPLYLRLDHELSGGSEATADLSRRSQGQTGDAPPLAEQVKQALNPALAAEKADLSRRSPTRIADTPPLAEQVKQALNAAFALAKADAPLLGPDETLWEYFHRKDVDIWSAKNRLLTPVLAFDQFEEIFTLGRADDRRRERSRAFLTELADLVENRPPAALRERFDCGEADPAHYNFNKPSCRVILSLREDFLPDLEGLRQSLPALVHNRLRLKRLNGAQALEAATRPAPHLLAEGVGEKIVEFVAGARGGSSERLLEMEVEPALLSVICRELNERRRALGQDKITVDLVSGNRREILTDFYERSVADLPEEMRTFVEDRLLTKSGFRDNLALETALEFPGVTRALIDTLVARRLLRIEERMGVQRVELTHDVLAEVIRASRDTHQQRVALAAAARRTRRLRWAVAGLAVAVVGLTIGAFFGVRAQRQTTRRAAHTDFLLGSRMIDEGKFSDGLAYLVRAGRKDPSSHVIGPRILSSLAARNFALPDAKPLMLPSKPASVEYTADGKRVFVQGEDQILRIIDSVTWRLEHELRFEQKIRPDGFKLAARNGGVFAVALADDSFLVGDATTGKPRSAPIRPIGKSRSLAPSFELSPDGRWLAVGSDSDLSIWDAASGKLQFALPVPSFSGSFVFSPDSRQIVTRRQRIAQRWLVSDGAPIGAPLNGPESSSTSLFGPGPAFHLRYGAKGSQLLLWNREWAMAYDAVSGALVRPPVRRVRRDIGQAWLNSDGSRLIFMGADLTANVVDFATGDLIHPPLKHGGPIIAAAVAAEGDVLFTNSVDGLFRLWDVATGKMLAEPTFKQDRPFPAACSPDGRTVALFPDAGTALRLRVAGGAATPLVLPRNLSVIPFWIWVPGPPARALLVMADQARSIDIASGSEAQGGFSFSRRISGIVGRSVRLPNQGLGDGSVVVVASGMPNQPPVLHAWTWGARGVDREVALVDLPSRIFDSGAFNVSEDGRYYLSVLTDERRSLGIWELRTGRRMTTIPLAARLITGRASTMFSPDGNRLAFRTEDSVLHVWDIQASRKLCTLQITGGTGRASVSMSLFSADSQRLLTGDNWGSVQVWDAATGKLLRSTQAHRAAVTRMENYSAEGRYYISASSDGTVQIWDGNTDTPASPLLADSGGGSVSFSPDIRRISTGTNDGAMRVWDVRSGLALSDIIRDEGDTGAATYFSRDGKFVALRFGKAIGFWSAPPEDRGGGVPDWLLRLATVCGAQRLEDDGHFVSAADEIARTDELRREIARLPGDSPFVTWARWLLDVSPTRSIGPAFTITPAEARKLADEMAREQAALAAQAKAAGGP